MKSCTVLLLLTTLCAQAAAQEDLRATLFESADAALEAAADADAQLLAPRAFERGALAYRDAESDLERGRGIDRIRSRLEEAADWLSQAVDAAERARTTFASAIGSREDAASANAETFAPEPWSDAEEAFDEAARRLETGDAGAAREQAAEAETLYRDAELIAIKAQILSQTRALLAQAQQARVPRAAPRTYARAARLLEQAEQALEADRYATDRPRSLADEASYEARHAMHIASRVDAVQDGELTEEDLILEYETALSDVADAADVAARLDEGPEPLSSALVGHIEDTRENERRLLAESEENRMRIAGLEDEIRELDDRLGGVSEERVALVQRLEAQAATRAQFDRIEAMFDRGEALVYREDDTVILRLVGLTFEVGESAIDPRFRPLLQKVRDAAGIFPRSLLIVEGHTDSRGGDGANLSLSRDRAEAVGDYLTGELGLPGYRVRSIGYGETRPIANNETPEGRARNRRIDVRIEPPAG